MRPFIAIIALAGILSGGPATAAILDFSDFGSGPPANQTTVPQSYGDIAGVDVGYRGITGFGAAAATEGGIEARSWANGYGDLSRIVYFNTTDYGEISFTPDAGQTVTLSSFEAGAWVDVPADREFRIYEIGNATPLWQSGPTDVPNTGGHLDFTPNVSSAAGLLLQWGLSANNVGLDNIVYSVAPTSGEPSVPAPALAGLLALAGVVVARRRRPLR